MKNLSSMKEKRQALQREQHEHPRKIKHKKPRLGLLGLTGREVEGVLKNSCTGSV